jgi:hypothetical protein
MQGENEITVRMKSNLRTNQTTISRRLGNQKLRMHKIFGIKNICTCRKLAFMRATASASLDGSEIVQILRYERRFDDAERTAGLPFDDLVEANLRALAESVVLSNRDTGRSTVSAGLQDTRGRRVLDGNLSAKVARGKFRRTVERVRQVGCRGCGAR